MYVFLPLSFGSYHLSSGIPADSGHRLFVIPHFSFDPRAFRGSGNSSHRRHPFVINNRLPSGEFYSFVFFFPITIQLCLHKNHNNRFLAVAGADQRENKLEFSLRGNEGGWVAVTFVPMGREELFCFFTGPPRTSDEVIFYSNNCSWSETGGLLYSLHPKIWN